MKAVNLPQKDPSPETSYKSFLKFIFFLPVLMLFQLWAVGQSANLDQGANDKYSTPLSPVDWINGNLNMNTAHFLEGHSVPYRAILKGLVPNQNYTLVIGVDIKHSSKHALDYITHFQRLAPHVQFGHGDETVNPLLNITGFPPAYFTSTDTEPIPAPSSAGSPVPGQPTASFNALPAGERLFTGYNADLLSVIYNSEGDLNGTQSETVIHITFKALKETVVLSWGGHIATMADWGRDPITNESRSASGINGSPYHMRLKNWIINGNVVSIGNQDRSLKTDAVIIPPTCEVSGPTNACAETPSLTYVATVDDPTGLTYAWSIIGANTANAMIVNPAIGTIQVVPIGATFTPGFFNLQLIVTRNGFKDTCYLNGHEIPGVSVIIAQVTVDGGSDQSITNLDVASLSASASGGTGVYSYTWTPTTGLDDPNIANPQFTPPSTGTFQFIVKAMDGNNCVDVDTVVINVTEHPKPPCGITGPDPVCPGSQNEYAGPPSAEVGSYLWSVTGDASILGDNNKEKVTIQADNKCGSYVIQLIVSTPDGKVKDTCYLTVNITDIVKPVLSGNVSDATVSCAGDVPAPPVVTATDNCVPELNVEMSVTVTDSTCENRFKVVRKWWATDACGNTSDTITQVITVYDDEKPVITADFEREVTVQCLRDIPAPPSPTATDNCNGNIPAVCSAEGSGTACDSTITRTWVFTDACGNSDFVTQVIRIKDDMAPVLTGNAGDVNVACADEIPAAANIGATDNCDENPVVGYSQTVTDSTCENRFKVVRKWWATDACGNTSDTITQVITVYDDEKPVITADFEREVTVQCLRDIPAPPSPTATDNCNGNIPAVYTAEGSGTVCDSTITRTWVFTDACGNSDFVTQVIMIKDDMAPVATFKPENATLPCNSAVQFGEPVFTDNCEGIVTVTYEDRKEGTACPFTDIRRWTATDACGNSTWIEQSITVECCKESFCTYTQGFYGNTGGKGCTPSGVTSTSKLMMAAAVDAQPGDSVYFGLKSTGKFFTLFLGDINNGNIFKMLPGGGTPVALKGYATFGLTNTWANVPILTSKSNYGKINNILLAQTMALFFNMHLSGTLMNLPIEGDSLFTVKIIACGTTNTAALADTFLIPANVVNYLKSIGKANVLGLYELANNYLGGQTVPGVTIANVNMAVDAINRGFDKCAFLVGWASSSNVSGLRSTNNVAVSSNVNNDDKAVESTVSGNFPVRVFPNPYSDKLIFHFVAPVKGAVNLEVFNILGQRLGHLNYGMVEKGSTHTIEYKVPAPQRTTLLYRLSIGRHMATGKAISTK